MDKLEVKQDHQTKLKEDEHETDQLEQRLAEELKIEESKLKMRSELERKDVKEKTKREKDTISKRKLTKLEITKFKRTHLDWMQFWGQFDVEIDRSNLTPVTKFSYLKDFVNPKVRILIDGLPFTSERYNRAKIILAQNMEDQASW